MVIDCDGHILEPPDLWEKYLEPRYYPHPDHPGNYLEELSQMVAPMPESGRRAILGENVARAYKLS